MKKAFRKPWQAFLFPGVYFLNISTWLGIGMMFYSGLLTLVIAQWIRDWSDVSIPRISSKLGWMRKVNQFFQQRRWNMVNQIQDGPAPYIFIAILFLGAFLLRVVAFGVVRKEKSSPYKYQKIHTILMIGTACIFFGALTIGYQTNNSVRDQRVVRNVISNFESVIEEDRGYDSAFIIDGADYADPAVMKISVDPDRSYAMAYTGEDELKGAEVYVHYKRQILPRILDVVYVTYENPPKSLLGTRGTSIIEQYEGSDDNPYGAYLGSSVGISKEFKEYEKQYGRPGWFMHLSSWSYDFDNNVNFITTCAKNTCYGRFHLLETKDRTVDSENDQTRNLGTVTVQATVDNRFFTPTYIAVKEENESEEKILLNTLTDEERTALYESLKIDNSLQEE